MLTQMMIIVNTMKSDFFYSIDVIFASIVFQALEKKSILSLSGTRYYNVLKGFLNNNEFTEDL